MICRRGVDWFWPWPFRTTRSPALERSSSVSNGSSPPTELLEAQLLLQIRAQPEDLGPLLDVPSERLRSVALPAILRYATDPRAAALLREEAQTGDPAAQVALQILDPKLDQEQSRFVATDPREPPWRRRLAAWRWDEIPSGTVEAILALPPADPDGMVYAAVLLAERHLSRGRASELADSWIRSFDDDQKRAGALLAAVLGEHADLLAEAYEAEDIGAVRTTQRLALHALGRPVPGDDPIEFAYRALAAPSGDFKPDVLMALLIAGHAPATERLAAAPPADPELYGDSIRQRIWLIERFVPVWYRRLGRPIGADLPSIRLYLDALWALSELSQRRLTFDAVTRTYSLAPTAAAGTPPR